MKRADTDRDADRQRALARRKRIIREPRLDPLGDGHRLLLVRLRQHDEELVAAVAGTEVVRPQLGPEGSRRDRERRVALEVAEAVVDPRSEEHTSELQSPMYLV